MIRHEERSKKDVKEIKAIMRKDKETFIAELTKSKDRSFADMESLLQGRIKAAISERDYLAREKQSLIL